MTSIEFPEGKGHMTTTEWLQLVGVIVSTAVSSATAVYVTFLSRRSRHVDDQQLMMILKVRETAYLALMEELDPPDDRVFSDATFRMWLPRAEHRIPYTLFQVSGCLDFEPLRKEMLELHGKLASACTAFTEERRGEALSYAKAAANNIEQLTRMMAAAHGYEVAEPKHAWGA